jgi:hypothetical protein
MPRHARRSHLPPNLLTAAPPPFVCLHFTTTLTYWNPCTNVQHLISYLSISFPIGNTMPNSLACSIMQKNYLKTPAEISYACNYFLDEVQKSWMLGPMSESQVHHWLGSHFCMSPVGLVPKVGKPGTFRVIHDLSHSGEASWSVNDCIDGDRPTIWTTFDEFAYQ